ncbi:hypothetical protein SAMN04487928_1277 [Butyrivibrio proteoclasticus]|uniref:Uncharacterized protein n=1 Tax=Butyrivibrio proteoclasticus TaxID=43305 RepID=A0A1I5WZX5_9FIRM|nr:hypothetical protein SAMN04487928_1277 [Butyrivibrio proteoclasticus]
MIRLFQNKSTTKGFAYIDAWISKYLMESILRKFENRMEFSL